VKTKDPDPSAGLGLGDSPNERLRPALHRVADHIADYLENVGEYPVLPPVEPGAILTELPDSPPETGEPLDSILDDFEELIEPNVTHWNHPGFLAYFGITASGPGIIGEALAAALNVNAMLWRTGPAAVELEQRVCDWVRQLVKLPQAFQGHINDTASTSTLVALGAARDRKRPEARRQGLVGGTPSSPLVVYASDQAHSSVDKAAMALGLGVDQVRRVASDDAFQMRVDALAEAVAGDRAADRAPLAVVATAGTTSTTSVDPLEPIADVCSRESLWLHVDAAYAGPAAALPELNAGFRGWERADSVVINPHKWLFTPIDCSVLLVRDQEGLKRAWSVVPAYLQTAEAVTNPMDLGFQLGRRFRALKLWVVMRAFGVDGIRQRLREHCRLARQFAAWVDEDGNFERVAPVPFSVVCFRALFAGSSDRRERLQRLLLDRVNAAGPVFLSGTELVGRFTLRVAVGNLRTEERHLRTAWTLLTEEAKRLRSEAGE
jgi:aromatic-L-amino-acid decarboxylase